MTPAHAWPWPGDSTLDRSRRVAGLYRARLQALDPDACAALDAWMAQRGQGWIAPSPWPYTDDDLVTCEQLAHACHVEVRTVYRWHRRGLPYVDTPDGLRIKIGDVYAFQRRRRLERKGV